METQESTCPLPDRERLLLAYLAGTISDVEADSFEAHCMTCDECSAELERGSEIRSALGAGRAVASSKTVPVGRPALRRLDWRWLAAAAGVVLAVSIWRFAGTEGAVPEPPVAGVSTTPAPTSTPSVTAVPPVAAVQPARPVAPNRSQGGNDRTLRDRSSGGLQPAATREANGEIRVQWTPVENASHYVLYVFATNGSQLLRQETATPSIAIDATTAAFPGHADERLFARIDAVDALGITLGQSPRITIPARREEIPR